MMKNKGLLIHAVIWALLLLAAGWFAQGQSYAGTVLAVGVGLWFCSQSLWQCLHKRQQNQATS
jgi:hypothetical protein